MRPLVESQVNFARGTNDIAAPTEYRRDEVQAILNGRVSFRGNAVERRDGSERTHAAALNSGAQGYGGTQYITAGGTTQLCVFVGDKFYISTDDGVNWTQKATGLDTAYWSTVQMRVGAANYLCCVNGNASAYYWDGTTWGTLSNAPSGATRAAVFNDRLYLAGHSGSTVAACKVSDPNTWASPDGFTVQVTTHDGDSEITGLYQIGTVLMVFKRDSTSYIEGFGYETIEVEAGARGVSRSVGCLAPRSIARAGENGICWLSERGFEYWGMGAQIKLISRASQSFMDLVSWSTIKNGVGIPCATYWPNRDEYWCALPTSSGQNDYTWRWRPPTEFTPANIALDYYADTGTGSLLIDPTTADLQYFAGPTALQADVVSGNLQVVVAGTGSYVQLTSGNLALAVATFNHAVLFPADSDDVDKIAGPFSVGYDGFVRRMEAGNTDDATDAAAEDGQEIAMTLRTRPFHYGDQVRRKQARTLRVSTSQADSATVTAVVLADGTPQTAHALTMPGTPQDRPTTKKARVGGKGYVHAVSVTTPDKVSVAGIELIAQYLREAL